MSYGETKEKPPRTERDHEKCVLPSKKGLGAGTEESKRPASYAHDRHSSSSHTKQAMHRKNAAKGGKVRVILYWRSLVDTGLIQFSVIRHQLFLCLCCC